jgi:hypothetical protein
MKRQGVPHFAALAKKIYRPQMSVGRILGGESKLKHFAAHVRMAQVLGIAIDELAHILLDLSSGQRASKMTLLFQAAGISKNAAAKKLGVDINAIYSIFSVDNQHIQLDLCRDISRGLGCSLAELSNILLIGKDLYGSESTVSITHVMSDDGSPERKINGDELNSFIQKFYFWSLRIGA